jgi:hypothetical protein
MNGVFRRPNASMSHKPLQPRKAYDLPLMSLFVNMYKQRRLQHTRRRRAKSHKGQTTFLMTWNSNSKLSEMNPYSVQRGYAWGSCVGLKNLESGVCTVYTMRSSDHGESSSSGLAERHGSRQIPSDRDPHAPTMQTALANAA